MLMKPSTMAVAKALGARRILALDINEQRLSFAKEYVATDVQRIVPRTADEDNMTYSKRNVCKSRAIAFTVPMML